MATLVTRSGKGSPLTHAEVDANFTNLNTDKLELSGGTMTGNLSFGDSDKAIFGAGSDLQIYHDGTHSYVTDQGTGRLYLQGEANVTLTNADGTVEYANFANNGAVSLRYNNAIKLATRATGVDITGRIATDTSLVISSTTASTLGFIEMGGPSGAYIDMKAPASDDFDARIIYAGASGNLQIVTAADEPILLRHNNTTRLETTNTGIDITGTLTSDGLTFDQALANPTDSTATIYNQSGVGPTLSGYKNEFRTGTTPVSRMEISNNGDISFYEDTGTTAKFFWDASAERLGIGTSSPTSNLDIYSSSSDPDIRITRGTVQSRIATTSAGGLRFQADYGNTADNSFIQFSVDSSEAMRITSDGNVGIGTNSPSHALHVEMGDANNDLVYFEQTTATGSDVLRLNTAGTGSGTNILDVQSNSISRFIVKGDGDVGIGTDSPNGLLELRAGTGSGTLNIVSTINAVDAGNKIAFFAANRSDTDEEMAYIKPLLVTNAGGSGNVQEGHLTFGTSGNERMRIERNGSLLVGKTIADAGVTSGFEYNSDVLYVTRAGTPSAFNRLTTDGDIALFRKDGTTVGSISVTASATAYNTSSDYRLKENVVSLTGATDRLKQIPVHRFNFISNPDTTVDGFLAHEVQDIVPEAVTGAKDAMRDEEYEVTPAVLDDDGNVVTEAVMGTRSVPDYQGIDQSKLVPLLVATIKELEARITALESA